jgi:adenylate kinase
MVRDRLGQADCGGGFLLDGYPRTLQQVGELDAVLEAQGARLDGVIELVAEVNVLVERLLLRARTEGRVDDTAEVIRRRQELFAEETAPLTAQYAERGLLLEVDADGPVEVVTARIAALLGARLGQPSS